METASTGEGFKRRAEETLRALLYMQNHHLALFYAALLQFLIIPVQMVTVSTTALYKKVRQLLTMLLVFFFFSIRGYRRVEEVSLGQPQKILSAQRCVDFNQF